MKYPKIKCNLKFIDEDLQEFNTQPVISCERLRTCQAEVITTKDYIALKSYSTIVAYIYKDTNEAFDILRYVYGYTATSAQHISKFLKDYAHSRLYRVDTDSKGVFYQRQY